MELFDNTRNFTRQNLEYLRYRSLFSRSSLKLGRFNSKPSSVLSLSKESLPKIEVSQFPQVSSQLKERETKSAPKTTENQTLNTEANSATKLLENQFQSDTDNQLYMSQSARIHQRGNNQREVKTPSFRVNQTTMYRTISPSRHHRNCVPKNHGKNSAKNESSGQKYIPPQTPANKSIGFDFCQEGHCIFPMSTRRHFRSRGRLTCDFCESYDGIDWYCKNCNKNFCTLCKHTHEMSRGSFTSYRDLMDRVFYQKTTLRHLAWRINDIKYQYENDMREMMVPPKKK